MAAISSKRSLNLSTLIALACVAYTQALPLALPLTLSSSTSSSSTWSSLSPLEEPSPHEQSLPSLPLSKRQTTSRSLPQHLNHLSRRYSDNNVGAAIGPLVGAVVLLFIVYIIYQRWRKRKDRSYFIRKEGAPANQARSSPGQSPAQVKEKGKTAAGGTQAGTGAAAKAVSSGGVLEVKSTEGELEEFPSRRESQASSRASLPGLLTNDKRDSNASAVSLSSLSQGMQGGIQGAKVSQGAHRKVEVSHVRRPEQVRTRAPVRGSEYWDKHMESETS